MFNCGMLAVELPGQTIDDIFKEFSDKKTHLETNFENNTFIITNDSLRQEISFSISDFDRALVMTGGWVEYADAKY
jgi:3-isopropylmalate/(R)-2-methylmalate dehydratase small subunit